MSNNQEFWGQKSFVFITGASRGLGRAISIEFSKKVAPGSVFLLVARTADALEETKRLVLEASPNVEVVTNAVDLGKPDKAAYLDLINSTVTAGGRQPSDFDHAILVHNAASLGNISLRATQYEDLNEMEKYYTFNLFSLIILNTQFLHVFNSPERQRSIVHISSFGAKQPFKTWGYYCAGKAARDMLMKSVSLEDPSINTISYGPGGFASAIYEEAVQNTGDEETRKSFDDSRNKGEVRTPEQTTRKLVRILGQKKYIKGEHVENGDFSDAEGE